MTTDLQSAVQRALSAWDTTTLKTNGDGMLSEAMESLRAEFGSAVSGQPEWRCPETGRTCTAEDCGRECEQRPAAESYDDQAPAEGDEPLFLLHCGQIDSGGEQDEWETQADSYKRVEEFCRLHPGQTVKLYAHVQPKGTVLVPVEPAPGLLMSMAIRHDHGLGMPGYYDGLRAALPDDHPMKSVTHAQRLESTLRQMRQLHEEVVGAGFYKPELEADYAARAPAPGAQPVAWIDRHELKHITEGLEPTVSKSPVSEHDVPLYAQPVQCAAVVAATQRERFEAWLKLHPDARFWNTTDAMLAAFIGGEGSKPPVQHTETQR